MSVEHYGLPQECRKAFFSLQLLWPKRRHAKACANVNNSNTMAAAGVAFRITANAMVFSLDYSVHILFQINLHLYPILLWHNTLKPQHHISTDLPFIRCAPPGFSNSKDIMAILQSEIKDGGR